TDPTYKAIPPQDGEPSAVRKAIEGEVQEAAHKLMDEDPSLTVEKARAQVWRSEPEVFRKYHAPGAKRPGLDSVDAVKKLGRKVHYDRAVRELSEALAPGEPRLGMTLVAKHFPALSARWHGVEIV
ncbi:MAG TPA: hypothetical protein VKA48_12365, partial [Gammaproteobacteria bacterium]|nr:hypothetical protein [Gammaproteobacteria bacterium]